MQTLYITDQEQGGITILTFVNDDPEGIALNQNLFELSRTTDLETVFDAAIHTRELISLGIEGHRPQKLIGQCTEADLPESRDYRDAWIWESNESGPFLSGRIVIDPKKKKLIDENKA